MAALQDVRVVGLGDGLKKLFANALWAWIDANGEQTVWRFNFKVGPFPISKTFRVRDVHAVFAVLLGAHP